MTGDGAAVALYRLGLLGASWVSAFATAVGAALIVGVGYLLWQYYVRPAISHALARHRRPALTAIRFRDPNGVDIVIPDDAQSDAIAAVIAAADEGDDLLGIAKAHALAVGVPQERVDTAVRFGRGRWDEAAQ